MREMTREDRADMIDRASDNVDYNDGLRDGKTVLMHDIVDFTYADAFEGFTVEEWKTVRRFALLASTTIV